MFEKLKGIFKKKEEVRPSKNEEVRPSKNTEQYQQWLSFKKAGITHVRSLSQRDGQVCSVCLDEDGKEYPVTNDFKDMPLPHSGCTNDKCRCSYL